MLTRKPLDLNKLPTTRNKPESSTTRKMRSNTHEYRVCKPLKSFNIDNGKADLSYQLKLLQHTRISYEHDHTDIIKSLLKTNAPNTGSLAKHSISVDMRVKMVNWLIEVLAAYECNDSTFFLAIILMDTYYKKESKCLPNDDVFLTGVTCVFMSSKFEDRCPLSMQLILESVAHNELSVAQVKEKENRIMELLEYRMPELTPQVIVDYVNCGFISCAALNDSEQANIISFSIFLSKMCFFSYELLSYDYGLYGIGSLLVAVKRMGYDYNQVTNWVCF